MTALGEFVTARLDEYGDGDRAAADPAPRAVMSPRVLTALRAILAEYEEAARFPYDLPPGVQEGRDDTERLRDEAVGVALEGTVMHIAAIWAWHPDFSPAWLQV